MLLLFCLFVCFCFFADYGVITVSRGKELQSVYGRKRMPLDMSNPWSKSKITQPRTVLGTRLVASRAPLRPHSDIGPGSFVISQSAGKVYAFTSTPTVRDQLKWIAPHRTQRPLLFSFATRLVSWWRACLHVAKLLFPENLLDTWTGLEWAPKVSHDQAVRTTRLLLTCTYFHSFKSLGDGGQWLPSSLGKEFMTWPFSVWSFLDLCGFISACWPAVQ